MTKTIVLNIFWLGCTIFLLNGCERGRDREVMGGAWMQNHVIRGLNIKVCKKEAIDNYLIIQEKEQKTFNQEREKKISNTRPSMITSDSLSVKQWDANFSSTDIIEKIKPIANDSSLC